MSDIIGRTRISPLVTRVTRYQPNKYSKYYQFLKTKIEEKTNVREKLNESDHKLQSQKSNG